MSNTHSQSLRVTVIDGFYSLTKMELHSRLLQLVGILALQLMYILNIGSNHESN